ALRRRVSAGREDGDARTGRLFVLAEDDLPTDSSVSSISDLPVRYFRSSDRQIVAAHRADACDETQLLHSRLEGEFLVSYETSGGWIAVTKDVLTEVLGAGRDARIVGLPPAAASVLQLMCLD